MLMFANDVVAINYKMVHNKMKYNMFHYFTIGIDVNEMGL